jgi:hypothetical protein
MVLQVLVFKLWLNGEKGQKVKIWPMPVHLRALGEIERIALKPKG